MFTLKNFFKNLCWGLFFYYFSFQIGSLNLYPYMKLIGCSILLYNLWCLIDDNEYFLIAYRAMQAIFVLMIISLVINSCSFLYGFTHIPNYILTILSTALLIAMINNFMDGIEKSTNQECAETKVKIRNKIIYMLIILILGMLYQNEPSMQWLLMIIFLINLILTIRILLELGNRLDTLGYVIKNTKASKQQRLKLGLLGLSVLTLFIMTVCMNIITVKSVTLSNEKLSNTSNLNDFETFNSIIHELPDNELQYYNLPIKNIEVHESYSENIKATTYMTEFMTEDSTKMVRFLIRIEWEKNPNFYGDDYLTLDMNVNEIKADTVNIFYTDGKKIYATDNEGRYITKEVSHMFGSSVESGQLVPNKDGRYIYYIGVTKKAGEDRLVFANLVKYYHKKSVFKYPYRPISEYTSMGFNDYFDIYNSYLVKVDK